VEIVFALFLFLFKVCEKKKFFCIAQFHGVESCPIYTNWYDPYNGIFLFARLVRVVQLVNWSWNNGLRVVQLVTCISLEKLGVYIQVHDPYESYDSYGSWNNALRVLQLVNCISLERLGVYIQVDESYGSWKNGRFQFDQKCRWEFPEISVGEWYRLFQCGKRQAAQFS